jgi:hypothetical protein
MSFMPNMLWLLAVWAYVKSNKKCRIRRGRDRMVGGLTDAYAISAYHY